MTWPHGTLTGYTRHGCRCTACREASRAYRAAWRARQRGTEPPVHNNATYSNYGCRCDTCREAHAEAGRRWYQETR